MQRDICSQAIGMLKTAKRAMLAAQDDVGDMTVSRANEHVGGELCAISDELVNAEHNLHKLIHRLELVRAQLK